MAYTNPKTWTVGELVTASTLNQQIKDNLNEIWKGTTPGDMDYYASSNSKNRIAIGTEGLNLKVVSGVPAWASAIGVKLTHPSSQSINDGVETEISNFNTEVYDSDGFHSGSNGYITIPANLGGLYLMGFSGYWTNTFVAGKQRQIGIKVAVNIAQQTVPTDDSGNAVWQAIQTCYLMSAGDTIKAVVTQRSGSSLAFNFFTLWAFKVG